MSGLFGALLGAFSTDMAIDLGTANTLIYVSGKGIVLNEPSVVIISKNNGNLLAIGSKAKAMYGKTPAEFMAVRPLKDGVIADFDSTKKMISYFIKTVRGKGLSAKPKIIIGVPSGITQVEKRAVIDSALGSGAREVHLVEEPMAAAIGTKMPVGQSTGNLIVDIGGGTTEVAIVSLFATAYNESIRIGGDEMDEAMVRYIRGKYNLEIGIFEGERVKKAIGSAYPLEKRINTRVTGRELVTSRPTSITLTDEDVRPAMEEPVRAICDAVRRALEKTTPEFAQEISHRGIVLAGGGALIKGLGRRLSEEISIPVYRAKDPLTAVARGVGIVLENWKEMRQVVIN